MRGADEQRPLRHHRCHPCTNTHGKHPKSFDGFQAATTAAFYLFPVRRRQLTDPGQEKHSFLITAPLSQRRRYLQWDNVETQTIALKDKGECALALRAALDCSLQLISTLWPSLRRSGRAGRDGRRQEDRQHKPQKKNFTFRFASLLRYKTI